MKKYLIILFIGTIMLLSFIVSKDSILDIPNGTNKSIVVNYCEENCVKNINQNYVENGNQLLIYLDDISNLNYRKHFNNIICESVCIAVKDFDFNSFCKSYDLHIIEMFSINNITVFNCYSALLKKYFISNNNKINLQIAFDSNIKIGYPFLYNF